MSLASPTWPTSSSSSSESDDNSVYSDPNDVDVESRLSMSVNFVRTCDSALISDFVAGKMITATLQCLGFEAESVKQFKKHRRAIRKGRKLYRQAIEMLLKQTDNSHEMVAFYFAASFGDEVKIVREPGSDTIGHSADGTASQIVNAVIGAMKKENIQLTSVCAVVCDGTTIKRKENGVSLIRKLELELRKPLHWLLCSKYLNDLILRELFEKIDNSPSFSGPIGAALNGCESLKVVRFKRISAQSLPEGLDIRSLENDHLYLYKIYLAVATGTCDADLVNRKPGPMRDDEWLTIAYRIMRLYIGTAKPSHKLRIIATFLMNLYIPMCFNIYKSNTWQDGCRHIYSTISYSRKLLPAFKNIIEDILQKNAYLLHPENLLLTMICDEDEVVRKKGLAKIHEARKRRSPEGVRPFQIPLINFQAESYSELIKWPLVNNYEPPFIRNIPNEVIEAIVKYPEIILKVPAFPCHVPVMMDEPNSTATEQEECSTRKERSSEKAKKRTYGDRFKEPAV